MSTADTSSAALVYIIEDSLGSHTASNPYVEARITGESLRQTSDFARSQELRADRQTPGSARTSVNAAGEIRGEWSYLSHDDFLAGVMFDAWLGTVIETGEDIDISGAAGSGTGPFTCTMVDAGATGAFTNASVGQWVRMGGFTNSSNDQFVRIDTKTDNNNVTVTGESAFTNESTSTGVTIDGFGYLNIGTTRSSFYFEKRLTIPPSGTPTEFIQTSGCVASEFELSVGTGSLVSARFGMLGLSQAAAATTSNSGGLGNLTEANSNQVMNSIDHVLAVREGGATGLNVQSLSLSLNNNLRAKQAIGSATAFDIGSGTAQVSGSMVAYFATRDLLNKFLNFTASDLSFRVTDDAGNAYVFDIPNVRFSEGGADAGAINQDVLTEISFEAEIDGTLDGTMFISRIAA